jgi:hypothetical protein
MHLGKRFGDMFQLSYITNDMDRALAHAADKLGITGFHVAETGAPVLCDGKVQDLKLVAAIANIGRQQFEILQPISGPTHVYTDYVDLDAQLLNFHHIAVAVRGPYANFEALLEEVREQGDEISFLHPPAEGPEPMPDPMVAFAYVNMRPKIGHHVEYLWWAPQLDGLPSFPKLA